MIGGVVVHLWAKQQATVALSSGEAEYAALATAAQEALWAKNLLTELKIDVEQPVLLCDAKAAIDMCQKQMVGRVKHVELRMHFLRCLVGAGTVVVRKVPTVDNVAGLLTKHVDATTLRRLGPTLLGGDE